MSQLETYHTYSNMACWRIHHGNQDFPSELNFIKARILQPPLLTKGYDFSKPGWPIDFPLDSPYDGFPVRNIQNHFKPGSKPGSTT